jgi:hypothetical protein
VDDLLTSIMLLGGAGLVTVLLLVSFVAESDDAGEEER